MSQLTISIVRADTNEAFDVDLPSDVPIGDLLPELTQAMSLPRVGPDGDLVAYELSSKRTGDALRAGTLVDRGVKTGDVLLLTSTFIAGGVAG